MGKPVVVPTWTSRCVHEVFVFASAESINCSLLLLSIHYTIYYEDVRLVQDQSSLSVRVDKNKLKGNEGVFFFQILQKAYIILLKTFDSTSQRMLRG